MAIRDLYNLTVSPVFNTYAQVAGLNRVQITHNTSSAYHVQYVACLLALRDSSASKFDTVLNRFYFSFVYWLKPITDERGKETGVPGECWNPHSSIGGRLGKQTCWTVQHVYYRSWSRTRCVLVERRFSKREGTFWPHWTSEVEYFWVCVVWQSISNHSAPGFSVWLVGWLLVNVPATCECISGTDLLNFTCCHTEIEVADPTFHLIQSQYTDTGPTSPSADPITPGAWQGSHWSADFKVTGMTRPRKNPAQAEFEPGIFRSRGGRLTTRPKRRCSVWKKLWFYCANSLYEGMV